MNNGLKIALIALLSSIAVGLCILLFVLINIDFKFDLGHISIGGGQSTTLIDSKEYDEVNNIFINSNKADVYIKHAEDNKIKVELYSNNEKEHSISLEENDLKVVLKENNYNLGKQARIILYVPADFSNKFDIKDNTGDVKSSSYKNASFVISLTTGDVNVTKAKSLDINTTTGDIEVLKAETLNVVTTSGDINNEEVNDINAVCTTGDITLGNVNNSLKLKATTGDITVNKIDLSENSSIQTTTGDVTIINKNNVYVETDIKTGDVKINKNDRFAEVTLKIKVTTGDIKVG